MLVISGTNTQTTYNPAWSAYSLFVLMTWSTEMIAVNQPRRKDEMNASGLAKQFTLTVQRLFPYTINSDLSSTPMILEVL